MDIEYYISVNLCNPQAAQKIIDGITNTFEKISDYPTSHPVVNENVLQRFWVRMVRYANYNIFYIYNLQLDAVYILRILYNRVDWQHLLTESD